MDAAIKEQWIKDLTSGEFEQGINVLERNGKFCCLGVLCFRAAEAGIVERDTDYDHRDGVVAYMENGAPFTGLLPPAVSKWAGIADDRAEYEGEDDVSSCLTHDNDYVGDDFRTIAETIRKYF